MELKIKKLIENIFFEIPCNLLHEDNMTREQTSNSYCLHHIIGRLSSISQTLVFITNSYVVICEMGQADADPRVEGIRGHIE